MAETSFFKKFYSNTIDSANNFIKTKTNPESDVLISVGASNDIEYVKSSLTISGEVINVSPEHLEYYATREPLVWRGLNFKSNSIWGSGFKILTDNKKAKKLCTTATLEIPNFESFVIDSIMHGFTYGSGYLEIIWNDVKDKDGKVTSKGKDIVGYSKTDPKTIKPVWDKKGYIIGYKQILKGTVEGKQFDSDKFAMFTFSNVADNVLGYGLVEPLVPTIHSLLTARISIGKKLFRFGEPFTHLVKKGATKKDIPKLRRVAQSISISKSFASSDLYDFKFHTPLQAKSSMSEDIDLLINTIAGGLGISKAILMKVGEEQNRAVLDRLSIQDKEEIKLYQRKVGKIIEEQILYPLLERNGIKNETVQIEWNDLGVDDEGSIIDNNTKFVQMMQLAVQSGFVDAEKAKMQVLQRLKLIDDNTAEENNDDENLPDEINEEPSEEVKKIIEEEENNG